MRCATPNSRHARPELTLSLVLAALWLAAAPARAQERAETLDMREDVVDRRLKIYFLPSYFYFTAKTI